MKSNLVRRVLSISVVVASTMIGLAGTAHATRSVPPPKTEEVRSPMSVTLSMETFNQRMATIPEISGLKKGDTVVLWDDGRVTDAVWQGNFTYYPAGSIVPRAAMYARWKDGVVTLTPTPDPKPGQPPLSSLDASFVDQSTYPTRNWQTVKTLVKDGSDLSVLRIPGNAWLFREDSAGQLTALVDVFVFNSGTKPIPHTNWKTGGMLPSTLPKETGSLPVPVAAQPGIH